MKRDTTAAYEMHPPMMVPDVAAQQLAKLREIQIGIAKCGTNEVGIRRHPFTTAQVH